MNKLISDNYGLEVKDLKLIEGQFSNVYIMTTNNGKYVVKSLPSEFKNSMEQEGYLTEYLHNNGINVARILKTKNGNYHVEKNDKSSFHVQEFIEGTTWKANTAPEWFLEKSANTIGKINTVLKDYKELKSSMSGDFLNKSHINWGKEHYTEELNKALNQQNKQMIFYLEERIKHLDRVSEFNIDTNKLTYSNSHADFHIGQIITNRENFTVIDWTSACKMPVCHEVIASYVFAEPKCKNGKIDNNGLKQYINNYLKNFSLNDYEIQMMPYIFYYQQMIMHYSPPYDNIPEAYIPICNLINNSTKWLYENVETLSVSLRSL